MWAIIGGSGFEKFEAFKTISPVESSTPFGPASSGIKRVQIGDQQCLFVSRHGEHHELLPSEVNYRANVFALKRAGATAIMSFSAIGSLRQEYKPGDLVIPVQYLDRTKGVRAHTFCGDGVVGHVSLAKPICQSMVAQAMSLTDGVDFDRHFGQTYVCIEGPYFSTQAESNGYRTMGADVIGMTHFPEFALVREAGLPYLPFCFVTDYDCWDDSIPHVTIEEVIQTMRKNNAKAFEVARRILRAGKEIHRNCDCSRQGLASGLMTPKEAIPSKHREWLSLLIN